MNNLALEGTWQSVLNIWMEPAVLLGTRWRLEVAYSTLTYHNGVAMGSAFHCQEAEDRAYAWAIYDLTNKLRAEMHKLIVEGIRNEIDQ